MLRALKNPRHVALTLAALSLLATAAAEPVNDKFQKAFFLQEHKGDLAAAEKLYAEVAADSSADAAVRAEAKSRREACREELACSDFTKLMPPNAWAYAELRQPGEQILRLLGQLGLLRDRDTAEGKVSQQIAISPELVRELLGIKGVAAAITGFDAATETPSGVAILHPGKLDVLRAALETALPAQCEAAESIEGCATYRVEDKVYVTITRKLVIVSPQRELIEDVIDRVKSGGDSLASNPEMAEAMKGRGDDLLYFCVNFKPLMPLIQAGLAAASTQEPEMAMAAALLDVKSLRSVTGRAAFAEDGIHFDVALNLDKGHQNLAFNFLRLPPVDAAALKRVPSGAAGFFSMALNEAGSRYSAKGESDGEKSGKRPPVTFLDVGREVFANIVGITVFALPSSEAGSKGPPIPDAAAVITVNDPAKSEALWTQFLGIASMAAGGGTIDGTPVDVEGAKVRKFTLPEGISIYFATSGNAVIISPSKTAIGRAVATQRGGKSILDDAGFSRSLARLSPDSVIAVFAHPGRCIEMGKPHMDADDLKEIQPFADTMKDTVASFVLDHSGESLKLSVAVTGVPRIGPIVSKMIQAELANDRGHSRMTQAMNAGNPRDALTVIEKRLAENSDDGQALMAKFDVLALKLDNRDAALAMGDALLAAMNEDANELNSFAWKLVDDKRYGGRYAELALKLSQRCNELTEFSNWMYLDTLAHAKFALGDREGAVELQRKALELVGNGQRRAEVERALRRFEAKESAAAGPS